MVTPGRLVLLGALMVGLVTPTAAVSPRTVALGDSITYGYPDRTTGWVDRLGFDNAGVPGDRTDQMMRRLPAVLAAKPRLVLVMGGTNDLVQRVGQEQTIANLRTILDGIRSSGAEAVLLTIAPPSHPSWVAAVDSLNDAIEGLATAARVDLIDVHGALAGPDGTFRPGYSVDGVHPSPAGYAAVAAVVGNALAKWGW